MWRVGTGTAGGYPKRTVDEWRLGYSWADVTPPALPVLSVARNGNQIVLAWPASTSSAFVLQSSVVLDDPEGWEPVSEPVVVQGGQNTVTVGAGSAQRFFRLAK